MSRVAFVFSGQGAQKVGMGKDLFDHVKASADIFAKLERLRPETMRQCFDGPAQLLTCTENAQPCLYAMELAAAAALTSEGISCEAVAGFSLGELSALAYSGAMTAETGFQIVCRRGELMQAASQAHPGCMVAALKLSSEQVRQVCAAFEDAWPVNYNCPGQTVVACARNTLIPLVEAIRQRGGKAVPLKVSGAFHSPLMQHVSSAFRDLLSEVRFQPPRIPLYANTTGLPYEESPAAVLPKQMCSPVQWQATIENMVAAGIDTFVEIGPGTTLCGFIERIAPGRRLFHVEDCASLESAVRGCREC